MCVWGIRSCVCVQCISTPFDRRYNVVRVWQNVLNANVCVRHTTGRDVPVCMQPVCSNWIHTWWQREHTYTPKHKRPCVRACVGLISFRRLSLLLRNRLALRLSFSSVSWHFFSPQCLSDFHHLSSISFSLSLSLRRLSSAYAPFFFHLACLLHCYLLISGLSHYLSKEFF